MKPRCSNQRNCGLTITEVVVVVVSVCVLAGLAYLTLHHAKPPPRRSPQNSQKDNAWRTQCVNNEKQIILAFKIWANDNNDKYPQQIRAAKGGSMEEAEDGNVAPIFQVMSNELNTPKILRCPADIRTAAKNFTTDFDNSHVSYFVNLSASEEQPESIFIGDDNLAANGTPIKAGITKFLSDDSVAWTAERHVNQGNIGFADGSVQRFSNAQLIQAFQQNLLATNRLAVP